MRTVTVSGKIEDDLNAALEEEAKRRRQTKSQLVATYIRDGLARFDSASSQILETQIAILDHLKTIGELAGASLHHSVEQTVIGMRQNPGETAETYRERLQTEYKKFVFEAVGKGGRIHAASNKRPSKVRVAP